MKKLVILTSFLLAVLAVGQTASLYAQCGACTPTPDANRQVTGLGWSFSFTRPCSTQSTTSGGNGGGIELTNGYFNGKNVFFKMHTPILNVQYQNNACGPYRDWQYQETRFQCNGTVVAPGRCNGSATTNCDNPPGGDVGSFCGVSVFQNDAASPRYIVLTSIVAAGWYRYQFEYYFYEDGSFRPTIKWTGVPSGCLNNSHYHTIYWRIDFDIEGPPNNIIEENVLTSDPAYYNAIDPIQFEQKRMADSSALRSWRIRNKGTNRAYIVYPPEAYEYYIGPLPNPFDTDFSVDQPSVPFQVGDVWALHYNNPAGSQEETFDCQGGGLCSGLAGGFWAHLDRFIRQTGGPSSPAPPNLGWIDGQDVVFWYSAKHMHQGSPTPPSCGAANGPYIVTDPAGPAW